MTHQPTIRLAPRQTFIKPMLATLVGEPFDLEGWIFEIKWDGYRAIAETGPKSVRIYSRNQQSFAENYPVITEALKLIKTRAILDGELVVIDQAGRSGFQLLQNYRRTGQGDLRYYIFDLLQLGGKDLKALPLLERKKLLKKLLKANKTLVYSDHIETEGKLFFKEATAKGYEGMIAKKLDSFYEEGVRSKSWLKVKCQRVQEAVIGGFTLPTGARQKLGALVLGCYEKGKLIYAGHTGGGFDQADLNEVFQKLRPLVRRTCPFAARPKTNTPATWVKPHLVCQVRFQEWTEDGRMRQPIFLGLRTDKDPHDVKREIPRPLKASVKKHRKVLSS